MAETNLTIYMYSGIHIIYMYVHVHVDVHVHVSHLQCTPRLLVPPLLKVFLQLDLSLLQEVLDVFNLRLQLPQLTVEALETVEMTIVLMDS